KTGYIIRTATAITSLLLFSGVFILVPTLVEQSPFLIRFLWQYHLLLSMAGLFSILGIFGGEAWSRFTLYFRIGITCLISFTAGGHPLVPALMVIAILQEAGSRQTPLWAAGIALGTFIAVLFILVPEQFVFGVSIPGIVPDELLLFLALTFPVTILSMVLSTMMERERRWRASVDRLDYAVFKLAEANLGYQSYAREVRGRSIAEERHRVSREIHDTVGYSLTNIRVMLEAASLQMSSRPEEVVRLIDQSMDEASLCLEQTRQTMRQLRAREDPPATGLSAVHRLVRAFSEVSTINVTAEYGNVPVKWSLSIEKAVYRLIQEGMTNALRHGLATEIMIYLWQDEDALRVIVRDNGSGTGEVKEGLGISGMRERVEVLNGSLSVGPQPDGFEVKARIPLSSEENSHVDSNTAG
ncbi:MAG: hypothetical protein DRZ90_17740, partial [Spirochaetes bacterium]